MIYFIFIEEAHCLAHEEAKEEKSRIWIAFFSIHCVTLEASLSVNLSPKVQRYLSTADEIIAKMTPTDSKANSNVTV